MALHPKWRAKVMTIKKSNDLTSLSLDELIGNLKVHKMIIKKDSKIVKAKVKRKLLALKANGEEHDENVKDKACLVAHASNEVCLESSYFSDENSSIDDLALDNEYDKKISKSVFVSNFPEDSTALDLWKVCSDYGTVVYVFIPFKRSNSGKRFAFVRFIKEFDFGVSLIGRAKYVSSIPNLPCIISKEGFQNVKLSYLGGMWVLFEFDSLASKEKFLNHSGIGSWFTKLIQATSSFENEERIVWIFIEGLPIKAWTPNTFRKIAYLWEDDQDDLSSDGESQEGDVANKADNNESDVDRVSESSFMHENDTAHKDVNICKKREVESHSEDPFNIYGILDGQKNNVNNSCSDEPKFPPSFTPDNNVQEKSMEENIKDTTQRVQSLSNKLNDHCSNRGFSSQRSMNSHSQKSKVGGSILDLMDELITVGQIMGYNMAGCEKNIQEIINSQGDFDVIK
nr:RNA-directed DNA polymerase, eukaryota, nucleotide-binding alpha-beta plait domain protein [Tanacetum cinerariifolium]